MKKISVVIPCYNATEYLDRCIQSILRQTIGFENIELILVDDASTDGGATLSLMMEYEKKYPDNIIVIPLQQNMRQGGARNAGVMYAGGEYLMFCDADDWLVLDAMEILYYMASKHDADVVEFQYNKVTEEAGVSEKYIGETDIETGIAEKIKYDEWEFGEDDENRKKYMRYCFFVCWNKLYRLQMIQSNNIRFAEHLICEEAAFTLPVYLYERKHVSLDAELYCYFRSPDSTMRSSWDDRKFDNIKVWTAIIQDLEERGLLEKYHNELEYMFYESGFGWSIKVLIGKEYTLTGEELNFFKKVVFQLFPGVLQNPYVVEKTDGWNMVLQTLLGTELTNENVPEFNRIMKFYLQKWMEIMDR